MYSKILTAASIAFFTAAAAAAQAPGIDAPTGAGIGSGASSSAPGGAGTAVVPRDPATDPLRPQTRGGDPSLADRRAPTAGTGTLKDAIELCDRLAGTERDICLRQAQENQERALAPSVGATPGRGSAGAGGDVRGAPAIPRDRTR